LLVLLMVLMLLLLCRATVLPGPFDLTVFTNTHTCT
jgi:hypothetical protein